MLDLETASSNNELQPNHKELAILNNDHRRLNLESIELIDIQGFDSELSEPQTASLTYQMVFGSYYSRHLIHTTATYSAPMPADWTVDTDLSTLDEFVRSTSFDITVTDSKLTVLEPAAFDSHTRQTFDINFDSRRLNEVIKLKLKGESPSSYGFDVNLVAEISGIVRNRLRDKLYMQVGRNPTSVSKTVDIVNGMGKGIQSAIKYGLNYKLVMTPDDTIQYDHSKPSVRLILSAVLIYEVGYNLSFDASVSAPISFTSLTPRNIKKFLDTMDSSYKVHEVRISRQPSDASENERLVFKKADRNTVDADEINNLFRIFDADKAASKLQALLNGVEQPASKEVQDMLAGFSKMVENSVRQRLLSQPSVRIELI